MRYNPQSGCRFLPNGPKNTRKQRTVESLALKHYANMASNAKLSFEKHSSLVFGAEFSHLLTHPQSADNQFFLKA